MGSVQGGKSPGSLRSWKKKAHESKGDDIGGVMKTLALGKWSAEEAGCAENK